MLVNKQLGYKNNSNLANNEEIDKGYRQKKNYSFKSLFTLFSYEMFGCLFTLLNSDLKIWSAWFRYFICVLTQYKKPQGSISFNKKAHFFWLTRYIWMQVFFHNNFRKYFTTTQRSTGKTKFGVCLRARRVTLRRLTCQNISKEKPHAPWVTPTFSKLLWASSISTILCWSLKGGCFSQSSLVS